MRAAVFICLASAVFGRDAEAAVHVHRPADASQVVLRLDGASGAARLAELRSAAETTGDVQALTRYIDALVDAGARTGDERYYGYAERALETARIGQHAALRLRRANLLQHRHEFREAERLLGELLHSNPRNAGARLMRAQIRLYLRDAEGALQDCKSLAPFADLLTSATCLAQARASLGDLGRAYALLASALGSGGSDAATRSWSAAVAAELAVRLGDENAAGRWHEEAHRLDPASHYIRITYADWLLSQGRNAQALQVSRAGPSLAERARAVLASADPDSLAARQLQLAWQEAARRGELGHAREQARFELLLRRNAADAHRIALASFQAQREPADALLLAQTAAATRDREALAAVAAWRREHRYEDVRLERLLRGVP